MKKFVCLLLALILGTFSAMAQPAFDLEAQSATVCQALLTGDYATVVSMLNDTAAAQLTEDMLSQTMAAIGMQYGELTAVSDAVYYFEQNAAVFTLTFKNGALNLSMAFDADEKLAALNLTPAAEPVQASERTLPEGVIETAVTLFPNSERSLNGLILTPTGADENTPYVVFIHGSGASDMDETMGPNKIFRDMAYDLAALGVGSIRFDKITYSHPELFSASCTVTEEYLEPVREAVRVLREHTGSDSVYAAGHSLGGMLTPWLAEECDLAGGVVLAGTPLSLWQMSYDQNLLLIESLPAEQRPALKAQVDTEREAALKIRSMTDEEAAAVTVFGMNGLYLKSIDILDQTAIAAASGKPFLFLWGEADVQVNRAAFDAWQERLSADGPYNFITYPGLNHMFMPAEAGDSIANVQAAYARPAVVPSGISGDIAAWIAAQ